MVPFSLKSAIFLMTSSGLFQLATAAVIYADFVLTPGGSLPLAASLGGLSELSEVTKAQCQYACSVDAACLAYQHSESTLNCATFKAGGHITLTNPYSTSIAWKYGVEGAPSCAEGINTFSGPGGFCQCDAVTQINNTPFGCEEIPTTPRPFAEFFADQAVATPFAAGVEFLNGQNRVTQDFCRGMCLGADNCNGYMYDPRQETCLIFRFGGSLQAAPAGFYILGYRWDAPTAVSCSRDLDTWSLDGRCTCGADRTENTPFGCLARALPPPGPSQLVRRKLRIMPGIVERPSFA